MISRITALRVTLVAFGLTAVALGPLMLFWPSGWRWTPHHTHYEQMLVGLYFTLGIFLIRAAKEPERHVTLIWFAVWSSVVHGAVMTVQAYRSPEYYSHLVGDIPAVFIAAAVLAALAPRQRSSP